LRSLIYGHENCIHHIKIEVEPGVVAHTQISGRGGWKLVSLRLAWATERDRESIKQIEYINKNKWRLNQISSKA
jgi:hypothetical protein